MNANRGAGHTLTLTSAEGRWSVLYDGQPLCAGTTEASARAILDKERAKIPGAKVERWDGDAGRDVPLVDPIADCARELAEAEQNAGELAELPFSLTPTHERRTPHTRGLF